MKKVIRLTESDLVRLVRRVIKEQAFSLGGLESMPDTGYDAVDSSPQSICKESKRTSELVLELFSKAAGWTLNMIMQLFLAKLKYGAALHLCKFKN